MGSIFAGFLKYANTDRKTQLENQTTELLAVLLIRSDLLAKQFVQFLCPDINAEDLEGMEFKVKTQEKATWGTQYGLMDLVIKGYKSGEPFIYVCVEIKIDASLHERDAVWGNDYHPNELHNTPEQAQPSFQIDGYAKHVCMNESDFAYKAVGILGKKKCGWPSSPIKFDDLITFDETWSKWAIKMNGLLVELRKEKTHPIDCFLIQQFLRYLKEGGIAMTGPFTLSEFAGLKHFLSFWEKLNVTLDPIQILKLPNRQVIRLLDEKGILFKSDIHWQWVKSGIRFRDEYSELPEFFIELELGPGKKNKRDEVIKLTTQFISEKKDWILLKDDMTYLQKTLFDASLFMDENNVETIKEWFGQAVKDLQDEKFGFLKKFKRIVDQKE